MEPAIPGLRVVLVVPLGESLVILGDIARALKDKLGGVYRGAIALCQLAGDWQWSSQAGSPLGAEWAKFEAEVFTTVKSQVEAEIREKSQVESGVTPEAWVASRTQALLPRP